MSPSRKYPFMAMALIALVSIQVCAHNHAGEKPTRDPVNVVVMTLPEIVSGLKTGQFSSQDLIRAYLHRIETFDRSGPTLNAIISLNASAMKLAKKSDMRRTEGKTKSPLDGVPFLVKDNIESKDLMATTAGSTALLDNITGRDSPLVARLRDSGAIILGKANLSQWANFRSSHSVSGWSAVGGLVKNPHVLDRQACGSSSGSAASAPGSADQLASAPAAAAAEAPAAAVALASELVPATASQLAPELASHLAAAAVRAPLVSD